MSDYKIKLGKFGEKIAAEFLVGKGYQIIAKNFYTRYGEVDLIAQTGDEILFIEVKTRTSNDFGYPEQAVDQRKIDNLLKAINIYLNEKNLNQFWRLDIISVELDKVNRKAKIRQFKDVGRG